MKANNSKYILITPAKNEDDYIENTIMSIINQTCKPAEWIIVNDNSDDMTGSIIKKYENRHSFIKGYDRLGDKDRDFASKVEAFTFGYNRIQSKEYSFIGCLDADITFENDYYQRILEKFNDNIRLGIAGGFIKEPKDGEFKYRRLNRPYSMPNSIQFLKRECYEDVGGFLPLKYGGEDVAAEVMARQAGWEVRAFDDISVFHHRIASSAQGLLRGVYKQGKMDYHLGNFLLSEIFICGNRVLSKPLVIGSFARMLGFLVSSIKREKRMVSKEFVVYFRGEQWTKIRAWVSSIVFLRWGRKSHPEL